jgi:hypothetical protein
MSAADIFAGTPVAFTVYEAKLQVRDVLVGGIPSDPSIVRKWLETRLGKGDKQLEEILAETIASVDHKLTVSQQLDALMKTDAAPSINCFKRNRDAGDELSYEGRCLKGALKEWANSAYPGTDWDGKWASKEQPEPAPEAGKTAKRRGPARKAVYGVAAQKGLMGTLAERVFVGPRLIGLGVKEPSDVEERIKRVRLPDGSPASAISRVEVVKAPLLTVTIKVRDNFLTDEAWSRIWQAGEEIGIGSDRARSDGMFDLVSWEKVK